MTAAAGGPASAGGSTRVAPADRRRLSRAGISAAGAGALIGLVGAYSYYDRLLRPLAHTFGPWILLAVAVSVGQTVRRAILRTSIALLAAIVAFHLGQRLIYWVKYSGDAYGFSLSSLALWCVLALVAGAVFAPVFARIGRSDWSGTGAAAGAVGLLLADAYRQGRSRPSEAPTLLVFAVLAVLVVLLLTAVTRRQVVRTVLLSIPCAVLAYAVLASSLLARLVSIAR